MILRFQLPKLLECRFWAQCNGVCKIHNNFTNHMDNETVRCALNNEQIVRANEYISGDLECPGCNHAMYFRKKHKRTLSNTVCNVRCTFVHTNKTVCESYEHKTAKKIIAFTLPLWKFITGECLTCGVKQILQFNQCGVEEATFGRFKLDVGVMTSSNIVGCIEIYKTHRVDKEKKQHLDSTIKWVEVKAADVLQAFQSKSYTLESINKACARCALCEEKQREKSERDLMSNEEWRAWEYNKIMTFRETTPLLTFGKHKGQSVIELSMGWDHFDLKDWWYVRYLAGYAGSKFYKNGFPIPRRVREQAQAEMEGSCIICEGWTDDSWKKLCTDCWRIHRNTCLRCGKYLKKNYSFCWDCNNNIKM